MESANNILTKLSEGYISSNTQSGDICRRFNSADQEFKQDLDTTIEAIWTNLRNDFGTAEAIKEAIRFLNKTQCYVKHGKAHPLLINEYKQRLYDDILRDVFGLKFFVTDESVEKGGQGRAIPIFLDPLLSFRRDVRNIAIQLNSTELLNLTDQLRSDLKDTYGIIIKDEKR